MSGSVAGAGKLQVDETKIYLVRQKADGYNYKIFHDGREERIEPEKEK